MRTSSETAVAMLLRIAEAVALEECEAVEHRRAPCPLQHDDTEHWCLSCQARKAVGQFMNA